LVKILILLSKYGIQLDDLEPIIQVVLHPQSSVNAIRCIFKEKLPAVLSGLLIIDGLNIFACPASESNEYILVV
jgi:hypothetical protein